MTGLRHPTLASFLKASPTTWRERLSATTAGATVALAPLPFASVDQIWVVFWCVLIAVSLASATVEDLPGSARVVIAASVSTMAFVVLIAILQMVSPWPADPIWQQAAALLGTPLEARPSASRLQPLLALGSMLLVAATFCRFVLLAGEPRRTRRVMTLLGYAGLAYALFGAVSFIVEPTSVLGQPKAAYRTNLTGTFLNRNNAATFFGTVTILWLLLLASAVRRTRQGRIRLQDWLWLLANGRAPQVLRRLVAFVVCLGVTAASGSRAGFVLTGLALILALVLYIRPASKGRWQRLLPMAAALAAVLLAIEFVGGSVGSRLHLLGLDDEGRFQVYRAGLDLIASRPWLGIGLGNFASVFPSVRPDDISMSGIWDRAHSTPLELAIEIGIPAFCVVALIWLWLLARLARLAYCNRDAASIAALATALLGTLHSLIDFPLQTPGYAVFFAAVVGTGLASGRVRAHAGEAPTSPAEEANAR